MKVIKELHELEHPLSEYVGGFGVDVRKPWNAEDRYFVYVSHRVDGDVIDAIVCDCTYHEAADRAVEVRNMIKAAKKVAS